MVFKLFIIFISIFWTKLLHCFFCRQCFYHCEMMGLQHWVGSFGQQCCRPWQQVTPHLLTYGFGQSLRIRLVVVVVGAVVVVVVSFLPLFSTLLFKRSDVQTTAKKQMESKRKVVNLMLCCWMCVLKKKEKKRQKKRREKLLEIFLFYKLREFFFIWCIPNEWFCQNNIHWFESKVGLNSTNRFLHTHSLCLSCCKNLLEYIHWRWHVRAEYQSICKNRRRALNKKRSLFYLLAGASKKMPRRPCPWN